MFIIRNPHGCAVYVPDLGRHEFEELDDADNVIAEGPVEVDGTAETDDEALALHFVAQGWEPVGWTPTVDVGTADEALMAAELDELLDGTKGEVVDRVAGDPVRAKVALQGERARPKPRQNLIDALTLIADKEG